MKRHLQFKLQVNLCVYENIKIEGQHELPLGLSICSKPLLYGYNQNQQISASLTPLSILKPHAQPLPSLPFTGK